MNRFQAFKYWYATHLHFKNFSYQMAKYGCNTANINKKLESMSEAQMFKFEWFANEYKTKEMLVLTSVECELSDVDVRYASKESVRECSNRMIGRRDSASYLIREMNELHRESNMQNLILGFMANRIPPEYILCRDPDCKELTEMRNDLDVLYLKRPIEKIIKYRAFFNPSKYRDLVHEEVQSS